MNPLHKSLAEILRPADQQDDFTSKMLDKEKGGYIGAKRLPDGSYAGIVRLAFTEAICMGVDPQLMGCNKRYCYELSSNFDMLLAFHNLQAETDTPTGWISSRPKPTVQGCQPICTAPKDGSFVQVFKFDQFDFIEWCRTGAFENGKWVEADSQRAGEEITPTHWKP